MRTTKTKIKANNSDDRVTIEATLETSSIIKLTPDELRHERKKLNDYLCEALYRYGFHRQDIKVS